MEYITYQQFHTVMSCVPSIPGYVLCTLINISFIIIKTTIKHGQESKMIINYYTNYGYHILAACWLSVLYLLTSPGECQKPVYVFIRLTAVLAARWQP